MKLSRLETWTDSLFIQWNVATGNQEGHVRMRGTMERARQTRMDERRPAMLERKEAMEQILKAMQVVGGLSPETLEPLESMPGMIQA